MAASHDFLKERSWSTLPNASRAPTPASTPTAATTPGRPRAGPDRRRRRASTSRRSAASCSATGRRSRLASRALVEPSRDAEASRGSALADHRARVFEQLKLLVENGAGAPRLPEVASAARRTTAATSPASRSSSRPTRRCRSSRACSGACSAPPCMHLGTEHHHEKYLPGDHEPRGARRLRDDRDRPRLGCRQPSAPRRPTTRRRRSSSSTPRSARRGRTTSATRPWTARPPSCSRSSSPRASTTACTRSTCRSATPNGDFLPGIGGEDDGLKGGLNGIDNGRLHFTGVRIPRTNLLNRYGDVAEDGTYSSPIDEPGPPLLHHARHPRAGPRLARRRRRQSRRRSPSRSRSPTATSAASSPRAATPTRR